MSAKGNCTFLILLDLVYVSDGKWDSGVSRENSEFLWSLTLTWNNNCTKSHRKSNGVDCNMRSLTAVDLLRWPTETTRTWINSPGTNDWGDEAPQAPITLWATGTLRPGSGKNTWKSWFTVSSLSTWCIPKFLSIYPCIQQAFLLQARVMGNREISGYLYCLWRSLLDLWEELFSIPYGKCKEYQRLVRYKLCGQRNH